MSDNDKTPETSDAEREAILAGLAKQIEDEFCSRANDRVAKERQWQECIRLYNSPLTDDGYFNPDKPFDHTTRRRRPTPNIVRTKCDTAIANCVSMQFAIGDKNWDLWPPANDDTKETAERCRLMEKEIAAQLEECKYPMHARRSMSERVVLGSGVMKGPVNTGKLRTKYVKQGDVWVPEFVEDKKPGIEHVSVWRFYPDMTVQRHAESISDIELHPMTALDLSLLRRSRGFDAQAIADILSKEKGVKASYYNTEFLAKIAAVTWGQPHMYKDRYTVIEYHGPVAYDVVSKLGLQPTYESPTSEYYGEVWVCCGKVIRMELENIEGACETPYAVSVWKEDPTSPFGFGHPLLLGDAQHVVTQAYHMMLDNASLTSGPQVSMYHQYIQPADGVWDITPNKVWLLTDPSAKMDDAIKFWYPTNVIANIMPMLQLARQFAEEESATTAIASGMPSPQAAESATGQLVMQQNSTTLLDFLSEEWDDHITEKIIRRMYGWNMQYNPKEEIKGDYSIDVRSSSAYKNKQLYIRDLERLSMETAQNPALALWVNVDELARTRLHTMSLPPGKIIRTEEEYQQAAQQAQQQPNPEMIELQIKAQEGQRADKELALKEAQLQFEMQEAQQRAQWDHEERMAANYARVQEAQAQVIKARSEVEREMIQLSARREEKELDVSTKLMIKENDNQAKVFIEGMRGQQKEIDQLLTSEELQLKREKGTGI